MPQQIAEDDVLAVPAIGARRVVQRQPPGLAAEDRGRQVKDRLDAVRAAPVGSETNSVSAASKRTSSRLAFIAVLASGHLKTRISPLNTIVGPARM